MFSTITAAPAKQSVSDTISVLSGRLSSATLLEDRRAAILGLRSFAKEYPASVASGALRSLIGSLSRDGEDVDTVKIVLETLLMLFNPNPDSPEASEEIALWLADEFTQRRENIALLLDFLAGADFYARLYALQLLSAILSARTELTEKCVVAAPQGVARLVAVLDDRREPIRTEALSLLTYLTPASVEIQMMVAYNSVLERVLAIVADEGGLVDGARVVEDCLILLANLLRMNPSNQAMFREEGYIVHLGRLLETARKTLQQGQEMALWAESQRNRNIYALLAVIRLFLVPGTVGIVKNQEALLRDHVLEYALQLAFMPAIEAQIKSEALLTCADIIRGHPQLQISFAGMLVYSPVQALAAQVANHQANGIAKVYVIDGLLDLTLTVQVPHAFDMRLAACQCLKAYFADHADVRLHFLSRAIEGHKKSLAAEPTNVLTTLVQPVTEAAPGDPYRIWFASVLMLHLLYRNPAAKARTMAVTEGDDIEGGEVVTCIQTITANLLSSIDRADDVRVSIGYLMLLLSWLYEDLDGVNDLLGEGSNVQRLIQAAVQNPHGDVMVQGLCTMLLGLIYEFSTKDSPVSRASLRETIMSRMGRDKYRDKMAKLRSYPPVRDYEILPQKHDEGADRLLPDVYFDETFADFFKDNYNRILRAIDRDPGFEISVVTDGVQRGISREMVDSLRADVQERERAFQEIEAEKSSLVARLGQEQADHGRTKDRNQSEIDRLTSMIDTIRRQLFTKDRLAQDIETANTDLRKHLAQTQADHGNTKTEMATIEAELAQIKRANEALQRQHQDEIHSLQARHQAANQAREQKFKRQSESARKAAETEVERLRRRSEADMADLKATISRLEVDLMKANKTKSGLEAKCAELEGGLQTWKHKSVDLEKRLHAAQDEMGKQCTKLESELKQREEHKKLVQGELDDLLEVFADVEEKASKYKGRLKALGESISDGEDAGEEDVKGDDNVD